MLFCHLKGHFKFLPIGGTVFSLLKKYNEIMLFAQVSVLSSMYDNSEMAAEETQYLCRELRVNEWHSETLFSNSTSMCVMTICLYVCLHLKLGYTF